MQAIQQIADDSFFIAGGNEHRKTMRGCGRKVLSPAEKRNRDIDKLIGIANKKQNGNGLSTSWVFPPCFGVTLGYNKSVPFK